MLSHFCGRGRDSLPLAHRPKVPICEARKCFAEGYLYWAASRYECVEMCECEQGRRSQQRGNKKFKKRDSCTYILHTHNSELLLCSSNLLTITLAVGDHQESDSIIPTLIIHSE